MVQERVERVLKLGPDPKLASVARELLAKAHFRAAMASADPNKRLGHLDAALQQTPAAAKLHFHRGLALWRHGHLAEALTELDATATREPGRRGLAYLRALARIAVEQILAYYQGVAALRAGDRDTALTAWSHAHGAGWASPELAENLTALLREDVIGLAQENRWQDLIKRLPDPGPDRIVAETASLAYFHLGYEAAQAGKWPLAAQHWRKANELNPNRYLSQNLALAEEASENWINAAEA